MDDISGGDWQISEAQNEKLVRDNRVLYLCCKRTWRKIKRFFGKKWKKIL